MSLEDWFEGVAAVAVALLLVVCFITILTGQ